MYSLSVKRLIWAVNAHPKNQRPTNENPNISQKKFSFEVSIVQEIPQTS